MDVPAGVTQEEGYTGFLIHLPSAVRVLIFLSFDRSLCRYSPFHAVKKSVELTLLVVKWSAVRNQSEIETSLKMRGMSPFLFVKLVQQRRTQNHAKPAHRVRRSSGPAIYWDHAVSWGGGVGVSVSDIGRVGKK